MTASDIPLKNIENLSERARPTRSGDDARWRHRIQPLADLPCSDVDLPTLDAVHLVVCRLLPGKAMFSYQRSGEQPSTGQTSSRDSRTSHCLNARRRSPSLTADSNR